MSHPNFTLSDVSYKLNGSQHFQFCFGFAFKTELKIPFKTVTTPNKTVHCRHRRGAHIFMLIWKEQKDKSGTAVVSVVLNIKNMFI